jgi:hypothetical protein
MLISSAGKEWRDGGVWGVPGGVEALLYGAGLRRRGLNVDFKQRDVRLPNCNGFKDRVTMVLDKLVGRLRAVCITVLPRATMICTHVLNRGGRGVTKFPRFLIQ